MVLFGLFNGVCVLPVLLSWFGPDPYLNAAKIEPHSDDYDSANLINTKQDDYQLKEIAIAEASSSSTEDGYGSHTNSNASQQTLIGQPQVFVLPKTQTMVRSSSHQAEYNKLTEEDIFLECQEYLQQHETVLPNS